MNSSSRSSSIQWDPYFMSEIHNSQIFVPRSGNWMYYKAHEYTHGVVSVQNYGPDINNLVVCKSPLVLYWYLDGIC